MKPPSDFIVIASGLVYSSTCSSLSELETELRLNLARPTGIPSPWTPSTDPTFATGQPNPSDCPDFPGHVHRLWSC